MRLNSTIIVAGVLSLAVIALIVGCNGEGDGSDGNLDGSAPPTQDDSAPPTQDDSAPPTGLATPIAPGSIAEGSMVNSFGVVRSSLDLSSLGHSGIDLVSEIGVPIYAVTDGVIVIAEAATDGRGGTNVKLLIGTDTSSGTGWVFNYEHVSLLSALDVGSVVTKGQQIATTTQDMFSSTHLELAHAFNDFLFHENQMCWVEQLDTTDRVALEDRFDNVLRVHPDFISSWQTVTMEGMLPWIELLDPTNYPDGPQLCYTKGTDVRVTPSLLALGGRDGG